MSGTMCIGRIGGRKGDWYAQLNMDDYEATILERGEKGDIGPVATVPIVYTVESDDPDAEAQLDDSDPSTARLYKIVYAPEAWATLASIKGDLLRRFCSDREDRDTPPWAESILDQIDRTLRVIAPYEKKP